MSTGGVASVLIEWMSFICGDVLLLQMHILENFRDECIFFTRKINLILYNKQVFSTIFRVILFAILDCHFLVFQYNFWKSFKSLFCIEKAIILAKSWKTCNIYHFHFLCLCFMFLEKKNFYGAFVIFFVFKLKHVLYTVLYAVMIVFSHFKYE